MNNVTYVTEEGLANLKAELADRIDNKRVEIAERLDSAIKMGDLKENADYHVAKEDQAFNEGRIKQLQDAVLTAQLIKNTGSTSAVRIGSTVTICEVGYEDEEEEYRIVGAHEADPSKGFISNESPIGRALIRGKVGQVVRADTPGGVMEFKILTIS